MRERVGSAGEHGPVVEVPVAALRAGDSPRLSGLDHDHFQALAELDGELPPILVHRATMRVIDGMHRLRAAVRNGRDRIPVVFFDGTEAEAFLAGVRANVAHGLPLTTADRRAAAKRIVTSHPHLSDRSIGATAGLAAKTVAAIRREFGADRATATRVGRDGRARPLDGTVGRRMAGEVIAARPDASLREIARAAGVSVGTARDVRERVRAGKDPVAPPRRAATEEHAATLRLAGPVPPVAGATGVRSMLHRLRRDPSLRYTNTGRSMLQWLDSHVVEPSVTDDLFDDIPPHSAILVGRLARECAAAWLRLAGDLERRQCDDTAQVSSW